MATVIDSQGEVIETGFQDDVPSASEASAFLQQVREYIDREFVEGIDFGNTFGEDKKESKDGKEKKEKRDLLLPGAQKLLVFLKSHPRISREEKTEFGNGHVEHSLKIDIVTDVGQRKIGEGLGACNTLEKRYRYRYKNRVCPHCGQATIRDGKAEWGGGFYCNRKDGGCGVKFQASDKRITDQTGGKEEVPDGYENRNAAYKIAFKRAVLTGVHYKCGLASIFNVDLDDFRETPAPNATSGSQRPREQRPTSQPQQRREPDSEHYEPPEEAPREPEPAPQPHFLFNTSALVGYINGLVEQSNSGWFSSQRYKQVPEADIKPLMDFDGLVYGVIEEAIADGRVQTAWVHTDGVLDRHKCITLLARLHAKQKDVVEDRIWSYSIRVFNEAVTTANGTDAPAPAPEPAAVGPQKQAALGLHDRVTP